MESQDALLLLLVGIVQLDLEEEAVELVNPFSTKSAYKEALPVIGKIAPILIVSELAQLVKINNPSISNVISFFILFPPIVSYYKKLILR